MARYTAANNKVVMFWESGAYGTKLGTAIWPGLVQEHTLDEDTGVITTRYLGTSGRNVDQFIDGPRNYTGALSYFPQDWRMVVAALGSNTDAGSPSPYTHTPAELPSTALAFTSGTLNAFTSFQIEDSKTAVGTGLNFVRTIKGCSVNSWSLNGTQGEPLSCDVDYIGQDVTLSSGASTAVTENTARPFMWKDVKLFVPSGTQFTELKDFSLSVNNNLEAPHYLDGTSVIGAPIPLNRDYEFTATIDASSGRAKTLWDSYFIGGSTFNMLMDISVSAGSRDAFITLSGCKLIDMEMPSSQEGTNEISLTIAPQKMTMSVNDTILKYSPW